MSVRFKYYLRGCGVGIIVASFIFIVTLHLKGGVMTDEKAMARASELGMVMSEESQTSESQTSVTQTQTATQIPVTESNAPDTQKATQKETQTQSSRENPKGTESATKDSQKTQKSDTKKAKDSQKTDATEKSDTKKDVKKDTKKEDSVKKDKDTKKEEKKDSEAPEEVSITIKGGEVCRQIAQKLQDKGLVKDAEEFRKYMQEHDYAKYIRVGTFTLKKGMSYSEIAQILTKR